MWDRQKPVLVDKVVIMYTTLLLNVDNGCIMKRAGKSKLVKKGKLKIEIIKTAVKETKLWRSSSSRKARLSPVLKGVYIGLPKAV
jgi:hypothetical protein